MENRRCCWISSAGYLVGTDEMVVCGIWNGMGWVDCGYYLTFLECCGMVKSEYTGDGERSGGSEVSL